MNNTKQVIIIRKDINMRKGKMIVQGCHASLKILSDLMINDNTGGPFELREYFYRINKTPILEEWLGGIFTKICVSVNSEAELLDIYNQAKEANILCSLIQDCGLTEFGGIPTLTCIAIGPDYNEKIDPITGHLPLL